MSEELELSFQGNGDTATAGLPNPSSAAGETQPAQPEPAKGNEKPSILTKEDVLQVVQEAMHAFSRQEQSARDKLEARIKTEFERQMGLLQKAGVQPTTEQVEALRNATRANVIEEERERVAKPAAQPAEQRPLDPISAEAQRIIRESGIQLLKDDPEAKTVDRSSPFAFLTSIAKAVEAKKARVEAERTQAARAQTPMMGGSATPGNPIANIKDIDQLYAMARKRQA